MPKKCKDKNCSRCCEYVRIPILDIGEFDKTWLKRRGIKTIDAGFYEELEIPSICPQLKDKKCKLGAKRPKVCKDYVCN